jgi:hypothetical protein
MNSAILYIYIWHPYSSPGPNDLTNNWTRSLLTCPPAHALPTWLCVARPTRARPICPQPSYEQPPAWVPPPTEPPPIHTVARWMTQDYSSRKWLSTIATRNNWALYQKGTGEHYSNQKMTKHYTIKKWLDTASWGMTEHCSNQTWLSTVAKKTEFSVAKMVD